ncbi:MAG: FHA domain-containing protein [Prevotellaceae bacterium]|jgi:hypothetical protein|nr:FHA domain-containing protein [Prevotellaceae bacterium]
MRCENCGWENPNENVKCEKCGGKLDKSSSGGAQQSTERESVNSTQRIGGNAGGFAGGFDASKTAKGCSECGYPIRPGDVKCPQCGGTLGGEKPTVPEIPKDEPKPKFKGTIIRGVPKKDEEGKSITYTASEKRLVAFLVTYNHNPYGEFFPIYEGRNFVGKGGDMDAEVQGDDSVSSKHFSILYRAVDSRFKFKDEQSINGTFVNGELIDEGELKNLDIITIGATKLVFMVIPKID